MSTDFRALCAELLPALIEYDDANPYHEHRALIARASAALDQSEPEGTVHDAALERIASIAHAGALIGFATETEALIEIRRLTQPFAGDCINRLQAKSTTSTLIP